MQINGAGGHLHFSQLTLALGAFRGIDEYGNARGLGQQAAQKLQPLCREF